MLELCCASSLIFAGNDPTFSAFIEGCSQNSTGINWIPVERSSERYIFWWHTWKLFVKGRYLQFFFPCSQIISGNSYCLGLPAAAEGELSPPANYSKCKTRARTYHILQSRQSKHFEEGKWCSSHARATATLRQERPKQGERKRPSKRHLKVTSIRQRELSSGRNVWRADTTNNCLN